MKIKKLNEWKCDMDIGDAVIEPIGTLKDMIEHFELKYNPRTGCYDCDGDVDLYSYYDSLSYDKKEEFDDLFVRNGKMTIKFGKVKGSFLLPGDCDNPYVLTSLEGCPESVGGFFNCNYNQITSLKGCPESVGDDFYCGSNQLTSLECCPESVGGDFSCRSNRLTILKGCPKKVGGYFDCCFNQLTSLEGCPKSVGGDFSCHSNQLTSLEGCPKSVGGWFDCGNNQLTSLKGCPESVGGSFFCSGNKTEFTKYDVRSVCDVKRGIYI